MLYHGLAVVGGGSILAGVVLGAIATFIIDREFFKAAGFAVAGAILTFFGLMHGESIGIGQTPAVAIAYMLVAVTLFGCGQFASVAAPAPVTTHEDEVIQEFDTEPAVS